MSLTRALYEPTFTPRIKHCFFRLCIAGHSRQYEHVRRREARARPGADSEESAILPVQPPQAHGLHASRALRMPVVSKYKHFLVMQDPFAYGLSRGARA